ncbi:hypothetical protein ACQPZK_16455 [Micromonospora sp. CA-249363]|uniref:hypothetical protein n=1 Tax=Micromonospora sp. CA-249363 TaxID=3239963 RepID=UPI003D8EB92A
MAEEDKAARTSSLTRSRHPNRWIVMLLAAVISASGAYLVGGYWRIFKTAEKDMGAGVENEAGRSAGALASSEILTIPSETELMISGACLSECNLDGLLLVNHPTWGRTFLGVVDWGEEGEDRQFAIVAVNSGGELQWRKPLGDWYSLDYADPPTDSSGNVFLTYDPGGESGVIILRAIDDGIDDFGTLPDPGEYNARFYGAKLIQVERTYQVDKATNDCDPNCAEGDVTHAYYYWNGTDYVE